MMGWRVAMDQPYHVTVFDNFHRDDPDEVWVSGTFATAEAAIAAVKRQIDSELAHFWSEVCEQDKGASPLDRLISQYNSFAEAPVAFDRNGSVIFDSTAYMEWKAAEMIGEVASSDGLQRLQPEPQPFVLSRPKLNAPVVQRFSPVMALWSFLSKPRPAPALWVAFIAFCLACALIYRALR
ncbi:MAG: hypothetical protein JO163_05235 [Methylobacteriaceae bacterium]|nr:hypothetical protein [Methylobacteriaceae bacterium]